MNPPAYLAHSSRGRMRIKVPSMRNDPDFFQHAADTLSTITGISSISTNPRCASILILHEGLSTAILEENALTADLFDLQTSSTDNEVINKKTLQTLSSQALGIGGTFSKSMFFYLLMGLAIRQAMQGNIAAPAASMFWYAYEILERANTDKK